MNRLDEQRIPRQRPDIPRRKNKKQRASKKYALLLFALVSVTVIVVVGFALRSSPLPLPISLELPFEGVFAVTPDPMPPDEVLQIYFSHIENGQFEHMYRFLTEISQETISEADFIERNRNIYEGIGATNIEIAIDSVADVPERPGRQFVNYTLRMDTAAGEITHEQRAIFEFNTTNNRYELLWSSNMIFPELGESDRIRVNILPAQRGRIYDRNWVMLAGPGPASAVGFVPGRMQEEAILVLEDIETIAALLEMTPEGIHRRLNASYVRDDTFVLLRTISSNAQDLIDELLTVQGIMISSATVRYYPLGRSAAHLVGYTQNINAEELETLAAYGYHMNSVIGRAGLESIFEEQLRARDGREIFIVDSQGNRRTTLAVQPAENGQNLHLTIDAEMQAYLYNVFTTDKSASVATNPITGEVLALVSTPSYDPNDFVRGMTTSVWDALVEDEDLPLFNRFRATFSPGSTMKALTAAIGIEGGFFYANENFGRSGLRWQQDESWGRFFVTTVTEYDGPANLNNAMAWSDNIYFAKATLRIGAEAFADGLRGLGFEERIPLEYGLFSSIVSRTGEITSDIQLADSGYGQGEILMNPVHIAAIYGAFVTSGNIIAPRLIYDNAPQIWIPGAFSPETANIVLESLVFSVDYGTGRNARIAGETLAGKTGTAEIKLTQDDTTGTEIGWFVLMTADEHEENPLLILSMVEDVHGRGGSGYVVSRVRNAFVSGR